MVAAAIVHVAQLEGLDDLAHRAPRAGRPFLGIVRAHDRGHAAIAECVLGIDQVAVRNDERNVSHGRGRNGGGGGHEIRLSVGVNHSDGQD